MNEKQKEIIRVIINDYMNSTLKNLVKAKGKDFELTAMYFGKSQGMIELLPGILTRRYKNIDPAIISDAILSVDRFTIFCLTNKIVDKEDFDFVLSVLNESEKK